MQLEVSQTNSGIKINFKNKSYNLTYPKQIWNSYPDKQVLIDNLAYLSTTVLPLVSNINNINYNTAFPLFKSLFDNIILRTIPGATHDYKQKTSKLIQQFLNVKTTFEDYKIKAPNYKNILDEKAVIPLSCGKDSLLTLGITYEIGLKPTLVYINDTISPTENDLKLNHTKQVADKLKLNLVQVKNEIEQLNDFDTWNSEETCVNYSHMITNFCLLSLPLLHHYNSKYLILGNQQDMNFPFTNKEGYISYPAYDQFNEVTKQQNVMIKQFTNNQASVLSVIEPLTNLAITKILNSRYPSLAKYQISCDCLNISNEKRWCHECNKCARLYLFMKAFNFDVKTVGYNKDLFQKKYQKYYSLFKGKEVDAYEKSPEARDQQLLAFYLAYKNNIKGYLVDKFKKEHLKEAKKREDELHKKFLTIHPSITMPNKIKNKVLSIYKEEIENY